MAIEKILMYAIFFVGLILCIQGVDNQNQEIHQHIHNTALISCMNNETIKNEKKYEVKIYNDIDMMQTNQTSNNSNYSTTSRSSDGSDNGHVNRPTRVDRSEDVNHHRNRYAAGRPGNQGVHYNRLLNRMTALNNDMKEHLNILNNAEREENENHEENAAVNENDHIEEDQPDQYTYITNENQSSYSESEHSNTDDNILNENEDFGQRNLIQNFYNQFEQEINTEGTNVHNNILNENENNQGELGTNMEATHTRKITRCMTSIKAFGSEIDPKQAPRQFVELGAFIFITLMFFKLIFVDLIQMPHNDEEIGEFILGMKPNSINIAYNAGFGVLYVIQLFQSCYRKSKSYLDLGLNTLLFNFGLIFIQVISIGTQTFVSSIIFLVLSFLAGIFTSFGKCTKVKNLYQTSDLLTKIMGYIFIFLNIVTLITSYTLPSAYSQIVAIAPHLVSYLIFLVFLFKQYDISSLIYKLYQFFISRSI